MTTSRKSSTSFGLRSRIGERLRELRRTERLPLRAVASAVGMDTALLSKIENGGRLPTRSQMLALAAFLDQSPGSLEALRIADKFWRENHENPAAAAAVALIQESAGDYNVNNSVENLGSSSSFK